MTTWLPRGLVFAAGMVLLSAQVTLAEPWPLVRVQVWQRVLLRLVQGTLINTYPTSSGTISVLLMAIFCVGALIWGFVDGMADARANPDPDRRRDLAMRWLIAGLVAGVVSGAVVWLISLIYRNVYADGLGPEVTAFAAFTALVVFLPSMLAVGLGGWAVERRRTDEPHRRGADGSEVDVFEVVRDDDRTGPIPPIPAAVAAGAVADYPEEYPSQVALAEREVQADETEQIAGQIHDETERIDAEIDRIQDEGGSKS